MELVEPAQVRRLRTLRLGDRDSRGLFVSDCGLTAQDVEGEPNIEVGYHENLPLRWQGSATEAAAPVRESARAAGVEHLTAIFWPENRRRGE